MGKRIKLGLIFSYDEGWIGGTYYILNLIKALNKLPFEKQPEIIILSKNIEDLFEAQKSGYLFLSYFNPYSIKKNYFQKNISNFLKFILKNNFYDKILLKNKIDFLFPANNNSIYDLIKNKLYWIPDFQHLYFPEYFLPDDIKKRNNVISKIAQSNRKLILSSKNAKEHFNAIYNNIMCKVHVIPFAVTHPDLTSISLENILLEFSIKKKYFIISNQFWSHKNHIIVLKAALELKKKEFNFQFLFTGKFNDVNSNNIYMNIINFVKTYQLQDQIIIIGFIEREKQLTLMKNSIAVIQPSLFEGWSTVIEDAKVLGKKVIASDIPIHREQISINVDFFNPNNHIELSEVIIMNLSPELEINNFNYSDKILEYANNFLNVLN
jgi:glycosyltransferase involved in cell wall biosynthesis